MIDNTKGPGQIEEIIQVDSAISMEHSTIEFDVTEGMYLVTLNLLWECLVNNRDYVFHVFYVI